MERVGGGGPGATAGRGHEGGVGALSAGSKLKRITLSKQARKQKKANQLMDRRTGTKHGAPTTVLLLPMSRSADVGSLAAAFAAAADRVSSPTAGAFTAVFERLKARLQVTGLSSSAGALELLDAAKAADVVVAVLSAREGADGAVDDQGLQRVALLRAQGMPAV